MAPGRRPAGGAGRRRRAARPPRPPVRLPRARAPRRAGAWPGCGCACGSPGGWSTGSCWSGWPSRRTRGSSRGSRRSSRPSRCSPRRWPRSAGRSPTGTPGCWPTCCGSRCRPGTRRPRRRGRRRFGAGPLRRGGGPGGRRRETTAGPRGPARRGTSVAASRMSPEPAGGGATRAGRAARRARGGRAAHAVWQALPGEQWPERLAEAAAATVAAGRGALLVVPDQRDVDALHAACAARLGADAVVALTAELGPAERYRRWLAVRRGHVRVVVGTRSAAFAPVDRLGLLAVWDDGDDLHAEPRAPYPHVRDVLVLRAHAAGAALLVAGFARTAEAHLLVESGWAQRGRRRPRHRARRDAPRRRARRDRRPARPRPRLACRPAPARRVRGGPRRARRRPAGARAGAPRRLPAVAGLRLVPGDRPLPALRGPARAPCAARRPAATGPAGCRTAGGAAAPTARSAARRAGRGGCAPGWSAPGARPRSWGGPSPA